MMLKLWSCVLIAGLSTSAVAQSAGSAKADIPASQIVTAANGASARCMARTTTQTEHPNWQFLVPVPIANQVDFAGKGFQPVACNGVDVARFKADVCDLAKGNDAVQARTEQIYGINARKMCAAAKLLLPDAADAQAN
jgi:hypothetical protein